MKKTSQDCEQLMKKMDDDDGCSSKETAIELLKRNKEKKKFRCKVSLEDRNYCQEAILNLRSSCNIDPSVKFPGIRYAVSFCFSYFFSGQ